MSSPTSSLKGRRGSKPSIRIEQLSGRRSTEFVRPSGGSSMKTRRWLSEFELSSRTGDNDRKHPYSDRHGEKHSRPCCHRWGSALVPSPSPKSSDKGGVKEWIKKHLQALGRALANLVGKAAAALPESSGPLSLGS